MYIQEHRVSEELFQIMDLISNQEKVKILFILLFLWVQTLTTTLNEIKQFSQVMIICYFNEEEELIVIISHL